MKVTSFNVNGLRAAIKKGFLEWLQTHPADVICLQETKATQEDIDVKKLENLGYHHHWFCAQKKGYSGVAIFSKVKPDAVKTGCGFEQSDLEGRVIEARFGDVTIVNAYFPSGTSGEHRQVYKYQWLQEMAEYLDDLKKKRKKVILAGDYNIAHEEIDIHNPKGNKNNSGFLPEERSWMTQFLASGWVDTFRHLNKDPQHYSWWSQRSPSVRMENKGWRIDYICATKALAKTIDEVKIYREVKFSDHCPVYTHFKLEKK